jgi:hypothetical protein
MAQARQIHSIVQNVKNELQCRGSSQTPTTQCRTGDNFTREQKQKTVLFFNRLQLIYGNRFTVQWPDEKTVMLGRREWAHQIDELTWDQVGQALERAKAKLIAGDGDYYWPDVGRILGLAKDNRCAAYQVFDVALPEGDGVKQARQKAGRQGMSGVWALMGAGHAE